MSLYLYLVCFMKTIDVSEAISYCACLFVYVEVVGKHTVYCPTITTVLLEYVMIFVTINCLMCERMGI